MNTIKVDAERTKKVEELKIKIGKEIEEELDILSTFSKKDEDFVCHAFALYKLRDFINNPKAFMTKKDMITPELSEKYIVSMKQIDIWLQKKYNFVLRFIGHARDCNFMVQNILNDHFFAYYFTNIFDEILYKENNA